MAKNKSERLNKEENNRIVDLYKAGYSVLEIAKALNYNINTVNNRLRGRSKIIRDKDWEIYNKHKQGVGVAQLKLEYNMPLNHIEKIIFKCATSEILSNRRS